MITSWRDIAARTRGRILSGVPSAVPDGVSIDSRTLRPGDAYFAIRGPVHDGHAFVASAAAAGASGVVVSDDAAASGLPQGVAAILVEDTTRALQDLALSVRRSWTGPVVAITGSVGKTTTKELARLLLSASRAAYASPGNLNNHHGLPLAILRRPEDAWACVLELGISTPGEMDRLVEIAAPDIGLVTLISPVHVGNFASFDALCDEKMKLPRGAGRALLNADDPEQAARAGALSAKASWFGEDAIGAGALRLAGLASHGLKGSTLLLEEDGRSEGLECPLPGEHQARNMLAAAALARALGVPWDDIRAQAAKARPEAHRGQVLELRGATILDDTYNSNPRAMRAALRLLSEVEPCGRRILVAGDMLELGSVARAEHLSLGRDAAAEVDVLVGVGPLSVGIVEGARQAGGQATHLPDAESAGRWLVDNVRAGDAVLVKGSRGVALDRAVDALVARAGAA